MIKVLVDVIMTENEEVDETLAMKSNELSIPLPSVVLKVGMM
jgi:hypothetical protein